MVYSHANMKTDLSYLHRHALERKAHLFCNDLVSFSPSLQSLVNRNPGQTFTVKQAHWEDVLSYANELLTSPSARPNFSDASLAKLRKSVNMLNELKQALKWVSLAMISKEMHSIFLLV